MVKKIRQKIRILTEDLDANIRIALYVVLALLLWMFTGLFSSDEAAHNNSKRDEIKTVGVYELTAQPYTEKLTVTARTEPEVLARVAAETEGDIAQTLVNVGDEVSISQPLLKFAPSTRKEQLVAAQKRVAEAKVLYEAARKLNREGYRSDTTLASRSAELAAAEQALAAAKKEVNDAQMPSPITGRVVARHVTAGQYLNRGDIAFDILGEENFLIVAHIAQRDYSRLKTGQTISARLINGTEVEGIVRAISAHADDATKTYRLEAVVDGSKYKIPTGMTAKIRIPLQETMAHKIPQSALILSDEGSPAIKIIEDDKIKLIPVEWYENLQDGLWVKDLPEKTLVVVRGQNDTKVGETVQYETLEPQS